MTGPLRGLLLALTLVCTIAPAAARPPAIAAASSLRPLLEAALDRYAADTGAARPTVAYASTGTHVTQIEHGAPFDLFIAADLAGPQRLVDDGRARGPVQPFARGQLLIWTLADRAPTLAELAEPRWTRIAIANPRHAPYGARAIEALRQAGVLAAVEPKLVLGENIGQAAQLVASGAADVGLIAGSLLAGDRLGGRQRPVADALHAPLLHGLVLLPAGERSAAAQQLLAWLQSPALQTLLPQFGLAPP